MDFNSSNPIPPYTNWATAAIVIQDAVDAAGVGDEVVVTNGTYTTGDRVILVAGYSTNRVVVNKPLRLKSLNGAQFTTIDGTAMARCVYLAGGASLSGFTLTNGAAPLSGGGILCQSTSATVSNCVLTGNSTYSVADNGSDGGGAYGGTLFNCILSANWSGEGGGAADSILWNCTLRGNMALWSGGGAAACTLNNCGLIGNSASNGGGASESMLNNCVLVANVVSTDDPVYWGAGGGAYNSTLNNCTVIGNSAISLVFLPDWPAQGGGTSYSTVNNSVLNSNTAEIGANYDSFCVLGFCCTTPMPVTGFGNMTNRPLFVDVAAGDLRLQSSSPCINAGNNGYAPTGPDLDGNSRIVYGTVDIGAYEYQNPSSVVSYAWLQQYGFPSDGSADFSDPDGDGMNNWQEWRSGTNPTNSLSVLRLLSPVASGRNVRISWQSAAGVSYTLERCTHAASPWVFMPIATNIPGQAVTTAYEDTNAPPNPVFYRVAVP